MHIIGQAEGFDQGKAQMLSFAQSIDALIVALNNTRNATTGFSAGAGQATQSLSQLNSGFGQSTQAVNQYVGNLERAGAQIQTFNAATTSGSRTFTATVQPLKQSGDALSFYREQLAAAGDQSTTTFQKIQGLGASFGQAAGAVTGLAFSFIALQKAAFQVDRAEDTLAIQKNRLEDMTTKLSKAIIKYGADSEEVAAIEEDRANLMDKLSTTQERVTLVQEHYTQTLVTFATTTGPLVVSTVSSITQGITSMSDIIGTKATASIKTFIMQFGPFGIALGAAAIGIADFIQHVLELQKAQENLTASMQTHDAGKIVMAQLDVLQQQNNLLKDNPTLMAGIFTVWDKLMGDPGELAGKIKDFWKTQTDAYNAGQQEWAARASTLPPGIAANVTAAQQHLADLLDPRNLASNVGITQTGSVNADYFKNWQAQIVKGYADVGKAIEDGKVKVIATLMSGNETAIQNMFAPTPKQMTEHSQMLQMQYAKTSAFWDEYMTAQKAGFTADVTAWAKHRGGVDDITLGELKDREKYFKDNKTMHDKAVKEQNDANNQMVENELKNSKQLADTHDANMEAWKQRSGVITEESKLISDMEQEATLQAVNHSNAIGFLTKQYEAEAEAISGLNSVEGLRIDQVAELALMEEKRDKAVVDQNTNLLHQADAVGIGAAEWIKYKAAAEDPIDTVRQLNDALEVLINTHADFLSSALNPTVEEMDAINKAYTDGVVGLKTWVDQQVLAQHTTLGMHDSLVKTVSDYGLWNGALETVGANLNLSDEQMKALIADFIATGNTAQSTADIIAGAFAESFKLLDKAFNVDKLKKVDDELKKIPGFKEFPGKFKSAFIDATEEQNKMVKQTTKFGDDIKLIMDAIGLGISAGTIKTGFKELTSDFDDLRKKAPDKKELQPIADWLKNLSAEDIINKFPKVAPALAELNTALAAPKGIRELEIQKVLAKYPEIFAELGVKSEDLKIAKKNVDALTGSLIKLASERPFAGQGIAVPAPPGVLEKVKKDYKPIGGQFDSGDDGSTKEKDFGLKAMQTAEKEAAKLNQTLNKQVIAAMNLVGNKSQELLNVMGGNFADLAKETNKDMVSMNQTMNKYLIAGMNLTGNKSQELLKVMGGNFNALTKVTNQDMVSMNQTMNKYVIAGMNLTGNKSAELDKVMTSNFNDLASHTKQWASNMAASIDKVTGAMQLAESTAKSLATAIGKLKDKDITVTTHFKQTGNSGGVHVGAKLGANARGGLYWANQSTSTTFGEDGDELALFMPLRQTGETRRGDYDITVPSPNLDVSAIKNTITGALSRVGSGNVHDTLAKLGTAGKTITVVLNQVEKIVMNDQVIMQIVRKKLFEQFNSVIG